jgi:hypothetical protein
LGLREIWIFWTARIIFGPTPKGEGQKSSWRSKMPIFHDNPILFALIHNSEAIFMWKLYLIFSQRNDDINFRKTTTAQLPHNYRVTTANYRKLPQTTAQLPQTTANYLTTTKLPQTTPNYRKLPQTTANYRKLPQTTANYRKPFKLPTTSQLPQTTAQLPQATAQLPHTTQTIFKCNIFDKKKIFCKTSQNCLWICLFL